MSAILGIVRVGDEWECRCRRADKDVPASCDFQYDSGRKSWFTRDQKKVGVLRTTAKERGMRVKTAVLPDVKIGPWAGHPSLAKDGPEFPSPPGPDGKTPMAYFPFQKGGIHFALQRKHTLFGDDMGLGKTIQAIGVMNAAPVKSALIFCPSAIKWQWESELDEWLNYYRSVGVAHGPRWPKTDIVIANYEILPKRMEELRARKWDVVIADEAQNLKNPKAKRTIAVYGGKDVDPVPCSRYLALTGTPIDNHPIDMFSTLRFMMPSRFSDWWAYTMLYCDGRFGQTDYRCNGASNMKTLGAILRENVMVRRLKKHVLKQLPPKRREIITLEAGEDAKKAVRAEMKAYENACTDAYNFSEAGDWVGANEAQLKALDQIAKARMQTAMAKIPPALELIDSWISAEKLLIVCYHRRVISSIAAHLGSKALTFHGDTKDRPATIRQFITDDSKRVMVMQIGVGGTGVDKLQNVCNHGIFFEFEWRPGRMVQAEDRLWRIGQGLPVLWSYFVLPDSVDKKFIETNAQKAWVCRSILDAPAEEAEGESSQPEPGYLL